MSSASSFEKKFKIFFWNLIEDVLPENRKVLSAEVRAVLVIRPDRLGDFVLSIPALEALQTRLEPGQMTIVAGDRNADLARFYFPKSRIWVFKKNIFIRVILWLRLWFNSFHAVIDFHSYPFSTTTTLLTVLSGSPIRIGFWATGDFREYNGISKRVFNYGVKPPNENLPEVQKSFLLVRQLFPKAKLGALKVHLEVFSRRTVEVVKSFYAEAGITSKDKVLGIHPTLRKQDNRWSQDRYFELVKQLSLGKALKIVVIHGKGEKTELKQFQKLMEGFSNVLTLPCDDLFFILEAAKRFDGLVCNDSGIMHVCSWITPIFAVFGPSNVKRWGPQNQPGLKHQVFQAKDGLCDSVKPKQVVQIVRNKLF
jgi:ADP-heptose:LPS heptosyltransferase